MTDKKFPYWLAVEGSKTVSFADLPHMMAKAMHPSDDEVMDYAAARINLENELPQAVRDGLLRVRNPAGLGMHTLPLGNALQRAVMLPAIDLAPFLNERGIELRLTPHGSGPDYWTLENAAAAMQEQLNWHDGTRAKFQDQLQAAAQSGNLAIRDPRTCLAIESPNAHTYWELVTPADVNAWLEKLGAPYRWSVTTQAENDTQRTPEYQAEYAKAWGNLDRVDELKNKRKKWEDTPAVTVSELERKEQKIAALSASIDALNASIFPTQPQPVHEPTPVVVPAKETTEQRRARWLVMLEAEEKRGKLGALQRVADREGVDRSNMRKDIEKARAIRTEQSRAGFIVSQLVQDGKRKG